MKQHAMYKDAVESSQLREKQYTSTLQRELESRTIEQNTKIEDLQVFWRSQG